jgi:hypothetical protein
MTSLVERAVLPLDVARSALYRFAFRIPPLKALVTVRDRRVALVASAHALVAFTLTLTVPTFLLAVGPILLGVAHVGADLRYLVLRRSLPRWWLVTVLGFVGAIFALRLGQEIVGANAFTVARIEYLALAAWIGAGVLAGGLQSGRRGRVLVGLGLAIALAVYAMLEPYVVRIVFTHVHNVVALALWMALFRGRWRAALLPLTLIAAATALLLSGATYGFTEAHGAVELFGMHVLAASDWLAPGLPARLAVGLTLSFAFLQSVHYSTWLLVVPQEDVRGQGTVTFRMAARSLVKEFGTLGFAAMVVTALVVVAGAFFGLARARNLYLSLAMFHGYLELALAGYFFTRGGVSAPLRRS